MYDEFLSNSDIYNLEYTFGNTGVIPYSNGVVLASADIENDSVSGDGNSEDNSSSGGETSDVSTNETSGTEVETTTESGTLTDWENSVLELQKAQVNLSMVIAFGVFLILGLFLARIVWRKL